MLNRGLGRASGESAHEPGRDGGTPEADRHLRTEAEHRFTTAGFRLGEREVTQAAYRALVTTAAFRRRMEPKALVHPSTRPVPARRRRSPPQITAMAAPDASAVLDWHQARRDQGVPTVGVLAGPVGLGVRAWRRWAGRHGRPVAQVATGDPAALAAEWVRAALPPDPTALARDWVRQVAGRPPPERMTRYDLDQLWRALPVDPAAPPAAAAHHLLLAAADGRPLDPDRLAAELTAGGRSGRPEVGRAFAGVWGLDPGGRWPPLLVAPPADADPADWFARLLPHLEAVAVAATRLPVGVCVPPAGYAGGVSALGGSRAGVLAREGLVAVDGVTPAALADRLRAAGVAPPPPATVARLTADGLAAEVAEAFVDAARAVRSAAPADAADDFRSVHERFLFEQLDSLPETAGLFRPNRPLPFRHGPQAGEGDLVADRLRLAVEVDGAYFHLHPDQYRRDRRKDWLYQRHGYLVLRFLADDVVDDLETVLTTILDAVALRRSAPPAR